MIAARTAPASVRDRQTVGPGTFTVLVPIGLPDSGPGLLSLAHALIPAATEAEVRPVHIATGERFASPDESAADAFRLLPADAESPWMGEPIVREGDDIADEIVAAAQERAARLIVLGWQRPQLSRTVIGGTVAKVMRHTGAEVVVYYERRPRPWRRLLVPYLYGAHDRAAVGVARRLAESAESVTVLHVVEPDEDPKTIGPFRAGLDSAWCEVKVVPAPDPLSAAVEEARTGDYDAIVVGSSRTWGMGPTFIGLRHEQLARESDASMLIVRAASA